MLDTLPKELKEIIISYLTRKEYKASVPCKDLLVCDSYLPMKDFVLKRKLPIVQLTSSEQREFLIRAICNKDIYLCKKILNYYHSNNKKIDIEPGEIWEMNEFWIPVNSSKNLEFYKWFCSFTDEYHCASYVFSRACEYHHKDLAEWLIEQYDDKIEELYLEYFIDACIANVSEEMLTWLVPIYERKGYKTAWFMPQKKFSFDWNYTKEWAKKLDPEPTNVISWIEQRKLA